MRFFFNLSPVKKVLASALLVMALAGTAWSIFLLKNSDCASDGIAGIDIRATRCALTKAGHAAVAADKTGDAAAAIAMFDTLTPLMQKINNSSRNNDAMRACQLASAHLADGVLSIYSGQHWQSKSRFDAALASCWP